MRIIRISDKQLREAIGDVPFDYLTDNDMPEFAGNAEISPSGKIDGDERGIPMSTDMVGDMLAPSSGRFPNSYGYGRGIREAYGSDGQENYPNQDEDGDGINNFYDDLTNNTLDNNNADDDTTITSETILRKMDNLLNAVEQSGVNSRVQAAIATAILNGINGNRGGFNNTTTVIPTIISQRITDFINAFHNAKMEHRVQTAITNKILDSLDLENLARSTAGKLAINAKNNKKTPSENKSLQLHTKAKSKFK